MTILDIPTLLTGFFDFLSEPQWRAWPFNAGYGEHIIPSIARLAFVSLIMGAIVLFLRVLFGPKGYFRDEEMDREAAEQIEKEKAEIDALLEKGEINEMEHAIKLKRIKG